jgi:orotate phosphoribosyltransferase
MTSLLSLRPSSFRGTKLTPETIQQLFEQEDACWLYGGDPKLPHAELSSGKHSDGFFDCLRVLRYPNVSKILAHQLALEIDPVMWAYFKKHKVINPKIWVISSAYAAITFGYDVAEEQKAVFMFVEKDCSDPKGKKMVWNRMNIPEDAFVLQIEELITTSDTFREVRRAVLEGNENPVTFLPFVGALVHRPDKLPKQYEGIEVIALLEKEVSNFDPEKCPLCEKGSKAVRPKKNWKLLTGKK